MTNASDNSTATVSGGGIIIRTADENIVVTADAGAGPAGETVFTVGFSETALQTLSIEGGLNIEATLNEDGQWVIDNTCPCAVGGTEGCDYPTVPNDGDYHLNGGGSGCLEQWDEETGNWLRVDALVGTLMTAVDGSDRIVWYAEGPCNWVDVTEYGVRTINGEGPNDGSHNYSFCALDDVPDATDPSTIMFGVCIEGTGYKVSMQDLLAQGAVVYDPDIFEGVGSVDDPITIVDDWVISQVVGVDDATAAELTGLDGTELVYVNDGSGGLFGVPISSLPIGGGGTFDPCLSVGEADATEVADLDPATDRILVCMDGDAKRYLIADILALAGGSSSTVTPFSMGQDAADWTFKGGNIAVLPAGPAGVSGYWQLESTFTDGTLEVGAVSSNTNDDNFVGEAGATVTFSPLMGGSYTGMRGHWIAT